MLQLCRAEDGEVFSVNVSVRDLERAGNLPYFLHKETGVDEEAVLAYLSDGRRLFNDNIRELAGVSDQTIYVFNKYHLDYDQDDVLRELRIEAPLLPPIEETVSATPPHRLGHLAPSYLRAAHTHHEHVSHFRAALHMQHAALRTAASSLDLHALALADAFDSLATAARRELDRQATLLAGVDADLRIVAHVRVHPEFMSPAMRRAIENGERPRTLGDYVSTVKMKQVAETCARTHEDLRTRFAQCEQVMARLTSGANEVRASATDLRLLGDADACLRRSQECFDSITDAAAMLEGPVPDPHSALHELKQLDSTLRNELQLITTTKNSYTEQCIRTLRQISTLNKDVVSLPTTLASLQASFRGKNSFSHIQRLHSMLFAYGATVVEMVRRKEFIKFFNQRAQSVLEVMAKLSASERKRRQVYRGEVHGQLPFETRGMDDGVPTIDFSPSGTAEVPYALERADIDVMLGVLDDIERHATEDKDEAGVRAVQDCRESLAKLIGKMDSLESGFDRIAERSLLSSSRLLSSRRRLTEADEQAYQELTEQLRLSQQAYSEQEARFRKERQTLQAEVDLHKSALQEVTATAVNEQERADRLERDLHHNRAQLDSELAARRIMEHRQEQLSSDVESLRQSLATALADATAQAKNSEMLRQELVQTRTEFDDVKALEAHHATKVAKLLEDQAGTLRNLQEALERGENLEAQIQIARAEGADVKRALADAGREKDRLLRAQANEHERMLRDHIAEADGDRAVLEHQFHELKAAHEDTDRRLKDAQSKYEVSCADAVGLKDELQRVEHELREVRLAERILRDDLNAGRASQSDFEQRMETSSRLVAQILDVAIAFRNSHLRALASAQAMTAHPTAGGQRQSMVLSDSAFPSGLRQSIINPHEDSSPIDPSDVPAALDALRAFDHDHFAETIAKIGSTIRKWQKQCKEYRERAKAKISFRNFTKGDLALFLPTRNSVSKPWAAFNVSFPHYFLQATGHLAEQLKTREWIVARITSITERVVNNLDPTSNPYGLGDGVKYYMLEVEDWTQQANHRRRVSTKRTLSLAEKEHRHSMSAPTSPLTPAPLEPEVEDSFPISPANTRLFPLQSRTSSSPTAGPSSLSRLLAQAPPEMPPETTFIQESPTPSPGPTSPLPDQPPTRPSPPPPPSPVVHNSSSLPSPLRPGSRASRLSTSSRFSVLGIPPIGSSSSTIPGVSKAVPTTALSGQPISSSPSNEGTPPIVERPSPSPEGSITDGMTSHLTNRRRTTSYHARPTSPLVSSIPVTPNGVGTSSSFRPTSTLANFASSLSLGVSFGRRKKAELASLAATTAATGTSSMDVRGSAHRASEGSAADLLKRF